MARDPRVVLVTGGTGNLGRAVVREFLERGESVVVTYRRESEWEEAKQSWVGMEYRLADEKVDLLRAEDVEGLVSRIIDAQSRLDVVVNLVGGYLDGLPIAAHPVDQWERMLHLNLYSCFHSCRAALPGMMDRRYGRIVNVASRSASKPFPGAGAYVVSKAAVVALTKAIAVEVAGHGITANVVLPGIIDTPPNRKAMPKADFSKWVKPESLAGVIHFLVSEESKDINGAEIPVYGRS